MTKNPLILLLFLLLTVACQSSIPPEIQIGSPRDPLTLDPRFADNPIDCSFCYLFFSGLMKWDSSGKVSQDLAEIIEVSEDGMVYTFTLQESSWSNGKPVTAEDFSRSWRSILEPENKHPKAKQLYLIKGAESFHGGALWEEVQISTPNSSILIIHLNEPNPHFLELLALPLLFPVAEEYEETAIAPLQSSLISNGPYLLNSRAPGNFLLAKKHRNHWNYHPRTIEEIQFYILKRDAAWDMHHHYILDWFGDPFFRLSQKELSISARLYPPRYSPAFATMGVILPMEPAPFNSKEFRQALSYSIKRETLPLRSRMEKVRPGYQIFPHEEEGQEGLFTTDTVQANQLFYSSLETLNLSPSDIPEITLLYPEHLELYAKKIQEDWQTTLKLTVHLGGKGIPTSDKIVPIYLTTIHSKMSNPKEFYKNLMKTALIKKGGWDFKKAEELIAKISIKDKESLQVEQLLHSEMPFIPVSHPSSLYFKNGMLQKAYLDITGSLHLEESFISNMNSYPAE